MNLEDSFSYIPILMPFPVLEAIMREVEFHDLPEGVKKQVVKFLHDIHENAKLVKVLDLEKGPGKKIIKIDVDNAGNISADVIDDPEHPETILDKGVDYIAKESGYDKKVIRKIIELFNQYMNSVIADLDINDES